MGTASDAAKVADEETWQARVNYYRFAAAIDVFAELDTTPFHTERVNYADKILKGQDGVALYALGVATNDTIKTAINVTTGAPDWGVTDNDMEFAVNSLYNDFAGVRT